MDNLINWYSNTISTFETICENIFLWVCDLGGLAWFVVILALGLSVGIVIFVRYCDRSFRTPWIHYLLYLVTVLPTWAFHIISDTHQGHLTFSGCLLMLMITMVPGIITVHAGWGIRQCGMIKGKYNKNINQYIGQILLFPVSIMLMYVFWDTLLYPLIKWSDTFVYYGGGFWRFVIGLIIMNIIFIGVFFIWAIYIIPHLLKTIGKYVLYIMSFTLWLGLVRIAYNWIYANFNGFGFIVVLFIYAIFAIIYLSALLSHINEQRCPMCHNCYADETGYRDEGISHSTSYHTEQMRSSDAEPTYYGGKVVNAKRLMRTTTAYHNWSTEHTCPNCGCKWTISHSEQVGQSSKEIERRQTEVY